MDRDSLKKIETVARGLLSARNILFITGAGLSADSGLPTYRGVGGLYDARLTPEGLPIETVLAGEMLRTRPEVTWRYLAQIEEYCRQAVYNRGHTVIREMETHFSRVWTLTQNIDGFHAAAGSQNVIEIHGNMRRLRCDACGWRRTLRDFSGLVVPPVCPGCGKTARPDVVFFNELLPQAALQVLERELKKGFEIYFWVGTTAVFPYIQSPLSLARQGGALTVEINPGKTELSARVDIQIPLGAAGALDAIWRAYQDFLANRSRGA